MADLKVCFFFFFLQKYHLFHRFCLIFLPLLIMVSCSLLLLFDSWDRVSLNSPWLAWDSLCRPAWPSTHRDLPASVVKIPGYSSRIHCFNSQQPMAAHDHLQFHARWRYLSSGSFGYQAQIWADRHIGTTFIHMHLKKERNMI